MLLSPPTLLPFPTLLSLFPHGPLFPTPQFEISCRGPWKTMKQSWVLVLSLLCELGQVTESLWAPLCFVCQQELLVPFRPATLWR